MFGSFICQKLKFNKISTKRFKQSSIPSREITYVIRGIIKCNKKNKKKLFSYHDRGKINKNRHRSGFKKEFVPNLSRLNIVYKRRNGARIRVKTQIIYNVVFFFTINSLRNGFVSLSAYGIHFGFSRVIARAWNGFFFAIYNAINSYA